MWHPHDISLLFCKSFHSILSLYKASICQLHISNQHCFTLEFTFDLKGCAYFFETRDMPLTLYACRYVERLCKEYTEKTGYHGPGNHVVLSFFLVRKKYNLTSTSITKKKLVCTS